MARGINPNPTSALYKEGKLNTLGTSDSGEMRFDLCFDTLARLVADHEAHRFAFLEQDQGRQSHNTVAHLNVRVGIRIKRKDAHLPLISISNLIDNRFEHPAGRAPIRTKIH